MSKKKRSYMDSTYTWGNIFMATAICVLVAVQEKRSGQDDG